MTRQILDPTRYRVAAALSCIDRVQAFKNAMLDAGIAPPNVIIGDGSRHRFHVQGDKGGSLNGWYLLHLDRRAAGSFGCWKRGINERWKLDGDFKPLTQAERKAFAIERQRQEADRQAEESKRHAEAVRKATYIWSRSTPVSNHPYLTKKSVKPHNVRCYRGTLVIPLYDESGVLISLQFIGDDGTKRMMKDGKAQGCYCWIGELEPVGTILICEGWATGASLYQHTGHFTVIAFSAGNLKVVAEFIRKRYPDVEIIICGDNDESGTGQAAARTVALAIGGKYIIPDTVGHDWNDVLAAGSK